jgi:HEAT repeat protein
MAMKHWRKRLRFQLSAASRLCRAGALAILSLMLTLQLVARSAPQRSAPALSRLDELLKAASFSAVDEAGKLGPLALPAIRRHVNDENYRARQVAMLCAGRIGADEGADILAAGLLDKNFNVQNAAANELAKRAYPGAASAILMQLTATATNALVREKLALAAGYLTLPQAGNVLNPIARGRGILASNARMALARLGDRDAQKTLIGELSASSSRVRYDALEKLIYVNDPSFLSNARQLLEDKSRAVRVGPIQMPRYRRVCDQAVDTLVSLSHAATSFQVSQDKVYSDQEIRQLTVDLKLN